MIVALFSHDGSPRALLVLVYEYTSSTLYVEQHGVLSYPGRTAVHSPSVYMIFVADTEAARRVRLPYRCLLRDVFWVSWVL